jgi:hypothetical protein
MFITQQFLPQRQGPTQRGLGLAKFASVHRRFSVRPVRFSIAWSPSG